MEYRSIRCDALLKTITKKDMLFQGDYCIDPYQNCEFGCLYCDSSFEKTVYVKTNAPAVLHQEIASAKKGMIIIGSVHDPYQPAENTYKLTRQLLQVIKQHEFPCHILTKSPLVLRDVDLLKTLHCLVTVSIISLDPLVSQIFEHNAPSPNERLHIVRTLYYKGISTGVAWVPILPYITDMNGEYLVRAAHDANARYFLDEHLELKGDQKQIFEDILTRYYPRLTLKYQKLYQDDIKPTKSYRDMIDKKLKRYRTTYNISKKIVL